VVPITPAKPKPKTPADMSTFGSCQIEASHNKQSAAVLFTPHKHCAGVGHPINEPQPSPTHPPAAQLATHPTRQSAA